MVRFRRLSVFLCVFTGAAALAAVQPGENILSNGKFEADQTDYPLCWSVYLSDRSLVKWMPTGGDRKSVV